MEQHESSKPSMSWTNFLISAVLIVIIMVQGRSILVPMVLALGVWMVLNDATAWIQARLSFGQFQLPRRWAMLLGLLAGALALLRLIQIVASSIGRISNHIDRYERNLERVLTSFPAELWDYVLGGTLDTSVGVSTQLVTLGSSYVTAYIGDIASSAGSVMSNLVYVVILVIFLLLEQGTFATKALNMFRGSTQRARFNRILDNIHDQTRRYVSMKTLVSIITAFVSWLVMVLAGLEHATLWATLIFILNFIPNIGSIIALGFPILMAVVQYPNPAPILLLVVALTLVQVAVGYFIEPRLMGNQLNISPFVVLVSLTVFGIIWGIVGMFLSVPLTVILMIVFGQFESTRPLAVLLSGDGLIASPEHGDEANAFAN